MKNESPDTANQELMMKDNTSIENNALPNPHDAFFKSIMSDLRMARKFFEIHLPQHYQAHCDLSTLSLQAGSFIETNLRQHFSDVLYAMKTKSNHMGYIYCLIEHITQDKPMTAFQVLRYQIAAMHQHMQQGYKKPPIVIPLIFYRGKQSPYPGSLDVFDCFEEPELAREILLTPHLLVDISVIPDEEIRTHEHVALLELLEKHISTRDMIKLIPDIMNGLLRQYLTSDQFKSVINYLQRAGFSKDYKTFVKLFNQNAITAEDKNIMQTFADYLRQEGRQTGIQEGIQEARREAARKMLAKGIDYLSIQEITGLSDAELTNL